MPGNTCALAFAGDTEYAYPMMMQIRQAMTGYTRIETRAMDITDINGHLLNHANHLMNSVYDLADPNYVPDNEFVFGGYSWVEKKFKIWRYYYDKHDKSFAKDGKNHRIISSVSGNFVAIGDQRENFKRELRDLLRKKYGNDIEKQKGIVLDMEPFEALCRMLQKTDKRDNNRRSSADDQVVSVYELSPCGSILARKERYVFKSHIIRKKVI